MAGPPVRVAHAESAGAPPPFPVARSRVGHGGAPGSTPSRHPSVPAHPPTRRPTRR